MGVVLKREVWERTQNLAAISSCTIMLWCSARDSSSFVHSCDAWSCAHGKPE